ncbi:MAG: hypothetical protein BWK80_18770 [Desulfobacteraceae bacterium IS3]|nr:MAG: hypothetical protein BWK80_18770 [Desulfobacteraceae bacterium IS3]
MVGNKTIFNTGLVIFTLFAWESIVRAEPEIMLSKGQTVYIPIYSHIYAGDREEAFYLAATLSIRNTDMKYSITVFAADYYGSDGIPIKKYIETPLQIKPMSSKRYVIKESDKSGGSGANFIVRWKSEHEVNIPIIESIMIGTRMQQGISFTSRGQAIKEE